MRLKTSATAPCKIGDRIKLVAMGNDPDPIPAGTEGTVTNVSPWPSSSQWQISVDWDVNRSLALVYPTDRFTVIS